VDSGASFCSSCGTNLRNVPAQTPIELSMRENRTAYLREKKRSGGILPPSIVFLVCAFGVGASLAEPTIGHVSSSRDIWGFLIEGDEISRCGVDHFN
jgi:hypothetical protein